MEKTKETAKPVQGTEREKTVQISRRILKELVDKPELLKHFANAIEDNLNAPIAYSVAKAMVKQTELTLK